MNTKKTIPMKFEGEDRFLGVESLNPHIDYSPLEKNIRAEVAHRNLIKKADQAYMAEASKYR